MHFISIKDTLLPVKCEVGGNFLLFLIWKKKIEKISFCVFISLHKKGGEKGLFCASQVISIVVLQTIIFLDETSRLA